jgi:hypothetical protein
VVPLPILPIILPTILPAILPAMLPAILPAILPTILPSIPHLVLPLILPFINSVGPLVFFKSILSFNKTTPNLFFICQILFPSLFISDILSKYQ